MVYLKSKSKRNNLKLKVADFRNILPDIAKPQILRSTECRAESRHIIFFFYSFFLLDIRSFEPYGRANRYRDAQDLRTTRNVVSPSGSATIMPCQGWQRQVQQIIWLKMQKIGNVVGLNITQSIANFKVKPLIAVNL